MPNDPEHRAFHTHTPDQVTLREVDDDGLMEIRLPIASTGDVRNEGDDPLSGAELRGMAQQIDSNRIGVFPEHGMSDMVDGGMGGYSQFEKLGYWTDADIEREASSDGEDLLIATARMPDPEPLPSQAGSYRQALSILKEQAKRGIPIAASIGWRDDPNAPGGVDLTEVSIVGIGADPRTQTEGGEALIARAVAASTERFDLAAFVRTLRDSGMRPLGPPEDPDRFESFEECVDALAEDPDLSREDAEEICGAWEAAKDNQSHDMTDDTDPDEGTDDEEQREQTDDADEETREGEQCPECETSVREDANYCRECGADLRQDDEEDEEDDMEDEEEDQADDEEDMEDDEESEEEQSADTDDDDERSADDSEADTSDLEARIADLEDELQAVRSGETDIATPDDPDDADDGETRDADDDGDTRDTIDHDSDPAEKPAWAR